MSASNGGSAGAPSQRAPIIAGVVAAVVLAAMAVVMVVMMGQMIDACLSIMFGSGSDPADEPAVEGVTEVRLEDFAFSPANIVVDVGTTVTWVNHDNVGHTVTSDDGDELRSSLLGSNGTFSQTFDVPGAYFYHCEPHPNMKGLVTVRASQS